MELEINNVSIVSGYPNRILGFGGEISNNGNNDVLIIRAWAKIRAKNITLIESECFRFIGSVINRQNKITTNIHIPLSDNILRALEVARAGGDIEFEFESELILSPISQSPPWPGFPASEQRFLMYPQSERLLLKRGSSYRIPQSDWVKLLSQMQYSEIELFEIPAKSFISDPDLKRAFETLRKAQDQFRLGHWKETLHNCRLAFEAAASEIGKTEDKKQNFLKLADLAGGGEKSKRLDDLIHALSEYAQLGRHEDFPGISITREDALAVLRFTLSIFELLG